MSAAPLLFFDAISSFDPAGGPWGRGYLRAEERIAPDDWFFDGHFKDDPCMPGTLMFEGCLQALALYMAGLGFTLHRDGWRFEPVPDVPYQLICRGQVIPTSQHLTYEVFVEEVVAGPVPTVYADFLCTVDGLKAFHARRVGLQLVPDWPLSDRPEVLADHVEPRPVAVVDGFPFGYASLIACAWGRPSHAFGPMYEPFDAGRHCARLPGPPYHFMTRITRVDGAIGGMEVGTEVELEYDVPPDAWYFDSNGNRTMPYCVLLEAALQPCGWIACYIGSALTTEDDLYFRNLDGTATWKAELFPQSGTLRTIARITNISLAGGMIIESFVVRCLIGDTVVYEMDTVFGFFPTDALANQIGITPTDAEREALHAPCDFAVDLTARPARYCGGFLRLPDPMLLMLDRITGFWPEGGKAGLGALRSEKDVDPSEWFFKAHFYTDPVQPGSLGIEAMVQLLQFYMLHTDLHAGMAAPRFEPLALNQPLTWKYRGQVVPHNETIRVELEITEVRREDDGSVVAIGDAWLWVDRLRIYQAIGMGMRIVDGGHAEPTADDPSGERVLDPQAEPWLADHRPTWTAPSLPAMSMVDRMAGAAAAAGGGPVSEVRDVQITRWVVLDGPTRTRVEVGSPTPDGAHTAWPVSFEVWREARDPRLSRFEAAATATVVLGPPPPAPEPLPELVDAAPVPDPYAEGRLFHGPAFHYLRALELGANGSRALLDPTAGAVPAGTLHQGLLDALTHALPHDSLHLWSDAIGPELVAYPHRVDRLAVYGPAPTGPLRVEARFDGFADEARSLPRFRLVATDAGRCPWVSLELTEVLLPKGPIGSAPPAVRQRFLRDAAYADGLGLSTEMGDEEEGGATRLTEAQVRASDWLPGTVARAYRVGEGADLLATVAAKDHVARRASVHPGAVSIVGDRAYPDPLPLTSWPLEIRAEDGAVEVRSGPPEQDISRVRDHWAAYFDIGRWPVEDLYYALIARFVGRVVQPDPEATRGIRGRSALYLANHQVMIESLLFSILASGVYGVNTVTLAKIEHQRTWLGQLIAHCFAYPDVRDPEVIAFFDREDKASLPRIIGELAAEMVGPGKSAMVHVEGTRSTTCRTPVLKMSSAFVDLALRTQAPIVPVRFVGGLPADPVPERIPFPLAMGRQDLWIGAPLWPAELEALPYKERKVAVIEAINGLGPSNAVEEPLPGDPEFAERVAAWEARTGATPVQSALYCALAEAPDPCPETAALLDAERTGTLEVPDDPRGRWLAELAEPMFGPRGPTVRRR